jgi:hypothetical protein
MKIELGVSWFLEFVHRRVLKKKRTGTCGTWICSRLLVKGWKQGRLAHKGCRVAATPPPPPEILRKIKYLNQNFLR